MENIWIQIISLLITFGLGYLTRVYLPLKFRREDKTPKISISPFHEGQNYFEITNHGGDILNLKIEISWGQDGKKETRTMIDFFNKNEDPAFGHPHKCNSLLKGESKKLIHCPMYSDNGEVKVSIAGESVNGKKYEDLLILKNISKK